MRVSYKYVSFALGLLIWSCHPPSPKQTSESLSEGTPERGVQFSTDAFKAQTGATAVPPNVVLLTIDTLRADFISPYGGPARTPNLTQLAQNGWLFRNCFSTSMLTNPSHASIMTSLFPKDHGVYDNQSGIKNKLPTLARAMASRGYRTLAVVSFPHLNEKTSNLAQGFEHVIEATSPQRDASKAVAHALDLVDRIGTGEQFFLWVHLVDPHAPYNDSPTAIAHHNLPVKNQPMRRVIKSAPGFQRTNKWFRWAMENFHTTHPLVNRYIAEIERADTGVGQLLDGLYQRGYGTNTAYFVTSDHGENLGERDLYFHHGGLYKETLHVPLIAYLPTETPTVINELVQTIDIAPTILEATQTPLWSPMRGRPLSRIVRGKSPGRSYVFSEHMHKQMVSVRSNNGTLLLHLKDENQFPSYPMRQGKTEFYDTSSDPGELHQITTESPLKQTLRLQLEQYLNDGLNFDPRPAYAQDLDSLRALGYLE